MADAAAAYCPEGPSQLRQKITTKFSDSFAALLVHLNAPMRATIRGKGNAVISRDGYG